MHSYNKIFGLLHESESQANALNIISLPKFSDKQLIELALAAESLGSDSVILIALNLIYFLNNLKDRNMFKKIINCRKTAFYEEPG